MNSDEMRNYATLVTATVALLVFVLNSFAMVRGRRLENLARFIESHQRLFSHHSYIAENIAAMEAGTLQRDRGNPEMEAKFHLMLLEIERLALMANNDAVPRPTQVYMFGSYARHLLKVITAEERNSMFWELALGYLDGLAQDTDTYEALTRTQRERFWR